MLRYPMRLFGRDEQLNKERKMKRLVMILMVVLLVSVLSGCAMLHRNGYADGRENLRDKDVEDILSRAAEFGLSSDEIPWERFLTPAQRAALELIRSQVNGTPNE